jgi:MtN3 and saliva related transmembrane protein
MAQDILAVAASSWAVLMGIAPLLQIRRMLRAQSSREISIGYFTILLIGFLLWIGYGAASKSPALVIPNIVALLVGTAVIIVALRLRSRRAGAAACRADQQEAP